MALQWLAARQRARCPAFRAVGPRNLPKVVFIANRGFRLLRFSTPDIQTPRTEYGTVPVVF